MEAETGMETGQDTVAADEPGNRTFAMVVRLRFALETGSLQRIHRAKLPANSAGLAPSFPADFEAVTAAASGFSVNHVQVENCESNQREDSVRESSGGWSSDRASTPQEISEAPCSRSAGDSRNPGEGILRTRNFGPRSGPVLRVERQPIGFLFGPALRLGAPNSKVTDSCHLAPDAAGANCDRAFARRVVWRLAGGNRSRPVAPGRGAGEPSFGAPWGRAGGRCDASPDAGHAQPPEADSRRRWDAPAAGHRVAARRLGPAPDLDQAGCPTPAKALAQHGAWPAQAGDRKAGRRVHREDDPRSDAGGGRGPTAGIERVNSRAVSAPHAKANPQSAGNEIQDNVGRAALCGIQCTNYCRPAIRCGERITKSVGFAPILRSDRAESSGFSTPAFSENARGIPAGYPSVVVVAREIVPSGKHAGEVHLVSAIPCAVALERAADFAVVEFSSFAKMANAAREIVNLVALPSRPIRKPEDVDNFTGTAKGRCGDATNGATRRVRAHCRDSQDGVGDFISAETTAEFAIPAHIRKPKPFGSSGPFNESPCGTVFIRAGHRVFVSFYQMLRAGAFSRVMTPAFEPIRMPKHFGVSALSTKSRCDAGSMASVEDEIIFEALKVNEFFREPPDARTHIRREELFTASSLDAKSGCGAGLSASFCSDAIFEALNFLGFFNPVFEVEKHIRIGEVLDTSCHFRRRPPNVGFSAARYAPHHGARKPFIFPEFFGILSDSFGASIHIRRAKLSGASCPGASQEFSGVCASESFAATTFSAVNSGEYLTEINPQKLPDFSNAISWRASSESITGVNAGALPDLAIPDLSESITGINAPIFTQVRPINSRESFTGVNARSRRFALRTNLLSGFVHQGFSRSHRARGPRALRSFAVRAGLRIRECARRRESHSDTATVPQSSVDSMMAVKSESRVNPRACVTTE